MEKKCKACRKWFEDDGYEWKKLCVPCYIKVKKEERDREFDSWWKKEEPLIKERVRNVPDKEGDWLRNNAKTLLMLCHPDKHNGSELSTEITKFLVGVYKG